MILLEYIKPTQWQNRIELVKLFKRFERKKTAPEDAVYFDIKA